MLGFSCTIFIFLVDHIDTFSSQKLISEILFAEGAIVTRFLARKEVILLNI